MTLSYDRFVADLPEFADQTAFPIAAFNTWSNLGYMSTNGALWTTTPGPGVAARGNFAFGANPSAGDTITLNTTPITFVSSAPAANEVQLGSTLAQTLQTLIDVLTASTTGDTNLFTYVTTPTSLLVTAATQGPLGNALLISASSSVITASGATLSGGIVGLGMQDVGVELFTAHYLTLAFQASQEAAGGAPPGRSKGPISSTSAVGAAVSYDTGVALNADDAQWNLTTYGARFAQMLRIVGAGPVQFGAGWPACGANYGALAYQYGLPPPV